MNWQSLFYRLRTRKSAVTDKPWRTGFQFQAGPKDPAESAVLCLTHHHHQHRDRIKTVLFKTDSQRGGQFPSLGLGSRSYGAGKPLLRATALLFAFVQVAVATLVAAVPSSASAQSFSKVIQSVQPKIVKVYGAGGLSGLEAYQSGCLISADGLILTAFSYVLDTDDIGVTLNDGRAFNAELVGADPRLELALLKIAAEGLSHFNIEESISLSVGNRILAFSNLYGIATGNEPASVLHGSVAAVTNLSARRGAFDSPYQGQVYVLDAITNNAGAAGGALTDRQGQLAGVLGKELRSSETNIWLNYALPISAIRDSIVAMRDGEKRPSVIDEQVEFAQNPWLPRGLGLLLVPDLLKKTPPFVEVVLPGSPAEEAGIQADDLIMYVGDVMVRSNRDFRHELSLIEQEDDFTLIVLRGRKLIPMNIQAVNR